MKKLPKSFELLGQTIVVEQVVNLSTIGDRLGDWKLTENRIRIQAIGKGIPDDVIFATFYHELAHAVLDLTGHTKLSEDEDFVERIGQAFYQAEKVSPMRKHLVIPDTQVRPDVKTDHFAALGNYIVEKQPDVIVHIGDHWDMPSLSSYDSGMAGFDQRDYLADVQAGNVAMNRLLAPLKAFNKGKRKKYTPRLVYTMGNHCYRVVRATQSADAARFRNVVTTGHFNLEGWEVHPFLEIVEIDGISYSHYFQTAGTGRPIGGTAKNKLTKLKFSYVMGHQQDKDSAQEYLLNGRVLRGLMAGAFYQHEEPYLGQCKAHWRGVHMLHEVRNGNYDHMEVSMNYLLRNYA